MKQNRLESNEQDNQLLIHLNQAQRQAVQNIEGPTLIVAGAGSGKTRVITFRIAYLLLQGVSPFSILALTFTNKAAKVMKDRIFQLTNWKEGRYLWAGTFHSIFARILREEWANTPYPQNFTIYDTSDSISVIRAVIKELDISNKTYPPRQILSRISGLKNELITAKDYQHDESLKEQDRLRLQPKFFDIYRRYCEKCIYSGAMDFDDLLLQTYLLLNNNPTVLQKYQLRFRHIMVDEYQDINEAQYKVVSMLADKFENICVVGDDAQSIYAFRGAKIKYIQEFRKRYANAAIYRLEQNYRSTKNIIGAANSIIKNNKKQIEKTLFTDNEFGKKVNLCELRNEIVEAEYIRDEILRIVNGESNDSNEITNGQISSYSQICILYRTNAQSRVFEEVFGKSRLPYQIFGNISFYQRSEVKDVLAYLKLIVNPGDQESFKRIIGKPTRGIGQSTVDRLIVFANRNGYSLMESIDHLSQGHSGISGSIIAKLRVFKSMIDRFVVESEKLNASDLSQLVVERTRIIDFVKQRAENEEVAFEKVGNIKELLNSVGDFVEQAGNDPEASGESLGAYLQNVALYTSQDEQDVQIPRVTLMTVHLSKGMEFPCVFVVGLEEDLFPSALNNSPEGVEEERRLMYVATTRAEKLLYLTHVSSRFRAGDRIQSFPSPFLDEIDKKFIFRDRKTSFYSPTLGGKPKTKSEPKNNFYYEPSNLSAIMSVKDIDKMKKVEHQSDDKNGDDHYPNLRSGSKVSHHKFGLGVVKSVEGKGQNKKAIIEFEKIPTPKKLLLAYAKIKILRTKS